MSDLKNSIPQEDPICIKCKNKENKIFEDLPEDEKRYLQLTCSHLFCLQCITFMYLKYKNAINNDHQIKCIICQEISDIEEEEINMIYHFTEKILVPLVKQDIKEFNTEIKEQNNRAQNIKNLIDNEMSTRKKMMKSYQQSVQKATPNHQNFQSKCQSPKSGQNKPRCSLHLQSQLSMICFTCSYNLICIKCVTSKRHKNHEVKDIFKGIQAMNEHLNLNQIEVKQHIQKLSMWQRRLLQRKNIIFSKCEKVSNEIENHFMSILTKLNNKKEQFLEECKENVNKILHQIDQESQKIQTNLNRLRQNFNKLNEMSNNKNPSFDFIFKSIQLIESINLKPDYAQINFFDRFLCPTNSICLELVSIIDNVDKFQMEFKTCNISKTSNVNIEMSKSDEKLFKQNLAGKRMKTNIISLNSSRDKKQKKCTKTQEDEKRNKSKANYKTESSSKIAKISKGIPTYLSDHLEKTKEFNAIIGWNQMNPLQSSFKSSSKILSKSQIPGFFDEGDKKKKKQHMLLVKERIQRKTVNLQNSKELRQVKKRKVHF